MKNNRRLNNVSSDSVCLSWLINIESFFIEWNEYFHWHNGGESLENWLYALGKMNDRKITKPSFQLRKLEKNSKLKEILIITGVEIEKRKQHPSWVRRLGLHCWYVSTWLLVHIADVMSVSTWLQVYMADGCYVSTLLLESVQFQVRSARSVCDSWSKLNV